MRWPVERAGSSPGQSLHELPGARRRGRPLSRRFRLRLEGLDSALLGALHRFALKSPPFLSTQKVTRSQLMQLCDCLQPTA